MLLILRSLGNEGKLKEKKNNKKIFEGSPGTHVLGGKLILKSRSETSRGVSLLPLFCQAKSFFPGALEI